MAPRFLKNVLSQYLRTQCDRQLYLSLFIEKDLAALGLPVPIKIRPQVQILRDEGKDWEQAKFSDLELAFKSSIRGDNSTGKYREVDLHTELLKASTTPAFIIQGKFTQPDLKDRVLTALGLSPAQIADIPEFMAFVPDIIMVDNAVAGEEEVLDDGTRRKVSTHEVRKALRVTDIKHAGEGNSSYSAEVTLYALMLAMWLKLVGLDAKFFVSSQVALWTREKEISSLEKLITGTPSSGLAERLESYYEDLEKVDFATFMQSLRHFFEADLPRVLNVAKRDWEELEWHVDPRCSACDFLAYTPWVTKPEHLDLLSKNPNHYCYEQARIVDHVSRIAEITKGARRTLEGEGYTTTAHIASATPSDRVFKLHNALRADRKHLPSRASALAGMSSVAPDVASADFPSYSDLEVFITVNFDPGTGLLTGLGLSANFTQRTQKGAPPGGQKKWSNAGTVVLSPDSSSEHGVLMEFLSSLSGIFHYAYDKDPAKGGANAANTRTHLYFWDKRQFIELTRAIGRHLKSILAQKDTLLVSLAWLFPAEDLLENPDIVVANPITFVKNLVRRALYLSIPHALTLFNVAEQYHLHKPYLPDSFMREPFSDMIPRERIYEIWSGDPMVKIGSLISSRSTCIGWYKRAVEAQLASLKQIVWKLRSDLKPVLTASARVLELKIPHRFIGLSDDSKLWLGWIELEEKCQEIERLGEYAIDADELEARYSVIRMSKLKSLLPDGTLVYEVAMDSRDTKFRDTESFLALQDDKVPNFLNRKLYSFTKSASALDPLIGKYSNVSLQKIFKASLVSFDRTSLEARVQLSDYADWVAVRQYLEANGHIDLSREVSLVRGPGISIAKRVRDCLLQIGKPSIATTAAATFTALGRSSKKRKSGTDPETPVARVLWDAENLANLSTGMPVSAVTGLINKIKGIGGQLNTDQESVVQHALNHRLTVVWGPPGTGKTTAAANLLFARIWHALNTGSPLRVLVTGPTYNAWEKLLSDALELMEMSTGLAANIFRIYSNYHPERAQLPKFSNPGISVTDAIANPSDPGFQSLVSALDSPQGVVIVGTVATQCYRIAKSGYNVFVKGLFDFMIIDESSQLEVCRSIFPLCTLADEFELVLLGDRLQMPPITVTEPPKGAEYMVGSIQTYLKKRFGISERELLKNYRSSQDFVEYAKSIGYPAALNAHSPGLRLNEFQPFGRKPINWPTSLPWVPAWGEILDPGKPVVAITYSDGRSGQANEFEAQTTAALVSLLYHSASRELDGELDDLGSVIVPAHAHFDDDSFWKKGIGVVTPHRAQRSLIVRILKELFPKADPKLIDQAVDTVERFQGGQRQTIIISFGVGDPDLIADEEAFLLQLERTNVAISRSRAKCVTLISDELACHLPNDKEVIITARAIKSYVDDFCRNKKLLALPNTSSGTRPALLRWR